jgi:chromosomal replication initiator protein
MDRPVKHGNLEHLWEKVKASLSSQIPSHSFRMWIEPLMAKPVDGFNIQLVCPNLFSRKRVKDHFLGMISSEFNRLSGKAMALDLVIVNGFDKPTLPLPQPRQMPLDNMGLHPSSGRFWRQDFTFDQFVVGKNNDFAYSAALSLAMRQNTQQHALFLLSKTGMGKSHLSQAIGHQILSENPDERVYYLTAEDFTNEMVASYKSNSINRFKEKYYKGCDVLLLEDVHYLSGKGRTQIELTHTLDSLFNKNKKILFSSCYSPSEIPKLSENLRSRLACGLVSNIEPPDYRMRMKILQKYGQANHWSVPKEVLELLATELSHDIRQLKSGLMGVTTKASLLGRRIDVPLAATVIKNIVRQSKNITINSIIKMVCKYYNVTQKELVSRSRKQAIVRPRQVAIYLSRCYTNEPLQVIGKSFNRYHATALHAIATVEKGIRQNGPVKPQVEYLVQKIKSGDC